MYPMREVKGSGKTFGKPCARCGTPLSQENTMSRRPPKFGLLSYCRQWSQHQRAREARANPEVYGGKCACCGETIALAHVNGGGETHQKRDHISTPVPFYRQVRNQGFLDTYRLWCHNCSCAIAWYGSCLHANSQPM